MGVGQQGSSRNRQQENGTVEDWETLRGDVTEMAGAAVERGRHFIDSAREQATHYVDRRKDDIAQSVSDFASSLRESTRSFEERPNIRAIADSAAEGLDQLADSIRERSFADIFNDFEDVVRRHPSTAAAVSVAIGFLAARFIKSSAEEMRRNRNRSAGGSRRGPQTQQDQRARESV